MDAPNMAVTAPSFVLLPLQLLSASYRLYYLHRVCFELWIKIQTDWASSPMQVWFSTAVVSCAVGKWCVCEMMFCNRSPLSASSPRRNPTVHLSQTETQPKKTGGEKILGRRVVWRSLFWHLGVLPHYSPLRGCSAHWHERLRMVESVHTRWDMTAVSGQVGFLIWSVTTLLVVVVVDVVVNRYRVTQLLPTVSIRSNRLQGEKLLLLSDLMRLPEGFLSLSFGSHIFLSMRNIHPGEWNVAFFVWKAAHIFIVFEGLFVASDRPNNFNSNNFNTSQF